MIYTIKPYKVSSSAWAFDDEAHGLLAEGLVSGMPDILLEWGSRMGLSQETYHLTFGDEPFPGFHFKLERAEPEFGGTWYTFEKMRGWLCSNLFRYFTEAPKTIYISVND